MLHHIIDTGRQVLENHILECQVKKKAMFLNAKF